MTSLPFELERSQLEGKVALITGASRGLGRAVAQRFGDHGLSVALCARHVPEAPAGVPSLCEALDVSDPAALEAFSNKAESQLGPIALWVNNAGVLDPMGPLRAADPAQIERALMVNIGAVANGSRIFANLARDRARDSRHVLVNISSGAAQSVYEGWAIYGATKAAVDQLTRTIAAEEPALICKAVAPGVVDTNMQAQIRTHDESTFPAIARFRDLHKTGNWNSPEWISDHLLALVAGTWEPDDAVLRIPDVPRR